MVSLIWKASVLLATPIHKQGAPARPCFSSAEITALP